MSLSVAIAGAGVGGLIAALACRQAGFEVTVFEQEAVRPRAGTAIELSPNATRVLRALQVLDAVAEHAAHPQSLHFRGGRSGYLIASRPLGAFGEARYGAPHLYVLRSQLIDVLTEQAQARGVKLAFDARVLSIVQDDASVTVVATGVPSRSFDVLLAADGAGSQVRAQLFPRMERRITEQVVWRALVPMNSMEIPSTRPAITHWLGSGAHFAHCDAVDGQHVSLLAVTKGGGTDAESDDSWTTVDDTGALQNAFSGWHPLVQRLIANARTCYRSALVEYTALESCARGRVALIGDAWHPTLPFLDQSAALAIEDGWVVSRILEDWESTDVADALREYEHYRSRRAARVQRAALEQGATYQLTGRTDQALRNLKLALFMRLLPELALERSDWLYGYDAVKGFG